MKSNVENNNSGYNNRNISSDNYRSHNESNNIVTYIDNIKQKPNTFANSKNSEINFDENSAKTVITSSKSLFQKASVLAKNSSGNYTGNSSVNVTKKIVTGVDSYFSSRENIMTNKSEDENKSKIEKNEAKDKHKYKEKEIESGKKNEKENVFKRKLPIFSSSVLSQNKSSRSSD